MAEYKYKAFISYSWADAAWGKWLQHRIETYRTPSALIGKPGAHGPVPARLHPLFKDREEEAAGSSIGAAVEAALANSEFLIVICSPHSAKSQWVEKEIAWFKTHRNPAKVLALIVDGEPGDPENECFPRALTHRVESDLSIASVISDAPLAADARVTGDGKRGARLKLAAALLGVGLDELVNRDERRRIVRTRIVVGASVALALVMSALALAAMRARDEADRQRAEADGLIEFMLTDLRERLEPVGRLDALDVVGQRALTYYARQKAGNLDAESLGRRSRALHLVGEVSNIRGDSEAGLLAFREAAATTQELLDRNPDDAQRVYDHAQSVFWVGYIAYERGESDDAEARFREYKRLADRLVALDPDKAEWQMESSYAESNLGVMLFEQQRYEEAERAFKAGLARIRTVAAAEEYDPGRQVELGVATNWVGTTEELLGKYGDALETHQREALIYRNVLRRDPSNTQAKNRLAIVMQYIGSVQLNQGKVSQAGDSYQQSLEEMAELRAIDPENTEWQETQVHALLGLSDTFIYERQYELATQRLQQADVMLAKMIATDPTNATWSQDLYSNAMYKRLLVAIAAGRLREAKALSTSALEFLAQSEKLRASYTHSQVLLVAGDVRNRLGERDSAVALWKECLSKLPSGARNELTRFRLLKRLGRSDEATVLAELLDRRGLRHPAYLAER